LFWGGQPFNGNEKPWGKKRKSGKRKGVGDESVREGKSACGQHEATVVVFWGGGGVRKPSMEGGVGDEMEKEKRRGGG